jgi:hypothetical protein
MGFNGNKGVITMPLSLLKLMVQSRLGVANIVAGKMQLKAVATPKFFQRRVPLLPLKLVAPSRFS